MNPSANALSPFHAAHFLAQVKPRIIIDWSERCYNEVLSAKSQNKLALANIVPYFLDRLIFTLDSISQQSHTLENLQAGVEYGEKGNSLREYSLDQVMHEFQILRTVITECLELEYSLAKDVQLILHKFLDLSIRAAASHFSAITTEQQSQRYLKTEKETLKQTQKVTDRREGVLKERDVTILNLEDERALREKFVGTLTHDLRTPMTAIKMTAQLQLMKANDPNAVRMACRRIIVNADRADRMIRDLLDVNRLKAGEGIPVVMTEHSLDKLIKEIYEELVILYGLRFHILGTLPPIIGVFDGEGIRRMVENLAGNAVKYGEPNSPISIGLNEKDGCAEIVVHNIGTIITPEDQAHLFQAFHRTKSAKSGGQKGWGIGLTVVDGISKSHGGKAWVASDVTQGTNFYISLPIIKATTV